MSSIDFEITSTGVLEQALGRIQFSQSAINFEWKWSYESAFNQAGHHTGWLVCVCTRKQLPNGEFHDTFGNQEFIPKGSLYSAFIQTCWRLAEVATKNELVASFQVVMGHGPQKVLEQRATIEALAVLDYSEGIGQLIQNVLEHVGFQTDGDDEYHIEKLVDQLDFWWEADGNKFDPRFHELTPEAQRDASFPYRVKTGLAESNKTFFLCSGCTLLYEDRCGDCQVCTNCASKKGCSSCRSGE